MENPALVNANKREFKLLSIGEAAYIAGFIDGEGTINVLKVGGERGIGAWRVELSALQVDPRPLDFIHRLLGGSICPVKSRGYFKNSRQPAWKWAVTGGNFDNAITQLLPFLINKKDKAYVAMAMRSLMTANGSGRRISAEENIARFELVKNAKKLSL